MTHTDTDSARPAEDAATPTEPDAKAQNTDPADQNDARKPQKNDTRTSIVNVLEHTYGPWLVILAFFVFLRLDPSLEVLIGFLYDWQARSGASDTTWSNGAAFVALASLPIAAHSSAYVALRYCKRNEWVEMWVLLALPFLCLIGYGWAFIEVLNEPEASGLKFWTVFWLFASIAALTLGYLWVFLRFDLLAQTANALVNRTDEIVDIIGGYSKPLARLYAFLFAFKSPKSIRSDVVRGFWFIVLMVVALLLVAIYVGLLAPSQARVVGPVGIVASFGVITCIVLSALTAWSSRMPGNAPLLLLFAALGIAVGSVWGAGAITVALIGAAVLSGFFGGERKLRGIAVYGLGAITTALYALSFAHVADCRTLAGCNMLRGVEAQETPLQTVADTVDSIPAQSQQPIRIVAAQGGGLYAAYHTAYYLAKRADTDPGFADSIYAISGVSGGSVGAGVYWAVRTSGACDTPTSKDAPQYCHRIAVNNILRRDYLTPSVATFLFRDLFDTFFPVSALWEWYDAGPIDRGHVLENEIHDAVQDWRETQRLDRGAPLDIAISDSAYVGGKLAHPLLFLNGTRVDNGTKAFVSPIAKLRGQSANLQTVEQNDLSVLNGMVISARFPLVTPPARVAVGTEIGPSTIQLVDGGYFDNSGIETALDIMLDLQPMTTRDIELIVFSSKEPTSPIEMKGTLGAPLAAFTGAWRARRNQSEARVQDIVTGLAEQINFGLCEAQADAEEINYTVSWYLSAVTFEAISTPIDAIPTGACAATVQQ